MKTLRGGSEIFLDTQKGGSQIFILQNQQEGGGASKKLKP